MPRSTRNPQKLRTQLFRSRLESTVASADCSPLRRLHDILEAQQGCVRRLRITWIHGAVEEVRDHRVHDLAKGIVDVHDLAGWHGRNHLAESSIDCLEITQRCHKLCITASNSLVVGLGPCLEQRTVHGRTHHERLVDGLQGLVGRHPWEGLQRKVGRPVNVLDERVGGRRELAGSAIPMYSALISAAGVEGAVGVMGLAFTTSLKSISAAYAAFASASFTVDIRKGGTSPLVSPEKAL